jgi:hypothetical protein
MAIGAGWRALTRIRYHRLRTSEKKVLNFYLRTCYLYLLLLQYVYEKENKLLLDFHLRAICICFRQYINQKENKLFLEY